MRQPTFLGAEALIAARLKERLPKHVRVLCLADVAGAQESELPVPSVRVVYDGYRISDENWSTTTFEQTYVVVVAVKNVRNLRDGSGAREEASPLIDDVIDALTGFQPEGYAPLTATNTVKPGYVDGRGYYPLAFTTQFRRKKPCESNC